MNFTTIYSNTLVDISETALDSHRFYLNKTVFSKGPLLRYAFAKCCEETWFSCKNYHCKEMNTHQKKGIPKYLLGEVLFSCVKTVGQVHISDDFAGKYIIFLEQNVNQTVLHLISFLNHLT